MNILHRLLIAAFDTIRPVFGFRYLTCIYPISCSDYAKTTIQTKRLYVAIPLIVLRVVSCNPLTAFIRKHAI